MKTTVKCVMLFGLLVALLAPSARAWNCPAGQIRQQAPAGTPTTTPYYDVVEGIAFICVPTTTTPPASSPSQTQSQNQSQNQSQSNSATSASNSTSTAASASNSTSTGGTSSSNATGGNSNVSNSGNSNVRNSNRNTAQGGAGGAGGTGGTGGNASSSASNNGNNANNSSSTYAPVTTTNVAAPKIPVETAIAPPSFPTVACFKGYGIAAQTAPFGLSFGGGKVDTNCAILETARQAPNRLARCMVYITDKYAKAAGVTLEKCMELDLVPVPVPAAPVAVAPPVAPQIIVVPVQTAVPEAAPTPKHEVELIPLGTCPVTRMNVCNRLIDSAFVYLAQDPRNEISVHGPLAFTAPILAYVKARGFSASRVRLGLDDVNTFDIGVVEVSAQ